MKKNEKIPNYFVDCYKAYKLSSPKNEKSFEEYYNYAKDKIYMDGMNANEICEALCMPKSVFESTLITAIKKIRRKQLSMGIEFF